VTKVTTTRAPNRITEYLHDVRSELRKVVWPTREEAINLTVVVLFITILMTLILGGLDFIFGQLLNQLISMTGG
jgi:preprotein translocase subunit SecE